jgi:hypothetical protein
MLDTTEGRIIRHGDGEALVLARDVRVGDTLTNTSAPIVKIDSLTMHGNTVLVFHAKGDVLAPWPFASDHPIALRADR